MISIFGFFFLKKKKIDIFVKMTFRFFFFFFNLQKTHLYFFLSNFGWDTIFFFFTLLEIKNDFYIFNGVIGDPLNLPLQGS
jgi:hypothetical protein